MFSWMKNYSVKQIFLISFCKAQDQLVFVKNNFFVIIKRGVKLLKNVKSHFYFLCVELMLVFIFFEKKKMGESLN